MDVGARPFCGHGQTKLLKVNTLHPHHRIKSPYLFPVEAFGGGAEAEAQTPPHGEGGGFVVRGPCTQLARSPLARAGGCYADHTAGYRSSARLFVAFDLPVTTKKARKEYQKFRKLLLQEGFIQIQYSVYARFFRSEERAQPHREMVKRSLPPAGYERMFALTDVQFARMESYYGRKRALVEAQPEQLSLF